MTKRKCLQCGTLKPEKDFLEGNIICIECENSGSDTSVKVCVHCGYGECVGKCNPGGIGTNPIGRTPQKWKHL